MYIKTVIKVINGIVGIVFVVCVPINMNRTSAAPLDQTGENSTSLNSNTALIDSEMIAMLKKPCT